MRIESLWIENFRSIGKLRLDGLGPFNIFYGENGAGKSNVLAAMEVLFDALAAWTRLPSSMELSLPLQASDFRFPPHPLRELVLGARLEGMTAGPNADGRFPRWVEFEVRAEQLNAGMVTITRLVTDEVDFTDVVTRGPDGKDDAEWWLSQLTRLARGFRLLPAVRSLREEVTGDPPPELRGAERIAALLRAGQLKQALVEGVTSPDLDVRAGLKRMQQVFQGEPLRRPPFDPIFDPSARRYELNEIVDDRQGRPYAVPVDLAGLGVQQIYSVMAGIFLGGASMVAVEEPEAHLHPRTTGRHLRTLLKRVVDEGHIDQLFIATHSNLFDLDPTGYFRVSNNDASGTTVERRTDFAALDREVFWEPGPARHALTDMLRYLPADVPVFRGAEGAPIDAATMIRLLQADDPDAVAFVDDVQATAVRTVQRLATRKK